SPGPPGLAIPGPSTPGLGRPDPAAADPDPFGLRRTGAAPAPAPDAGADPFGLRRTGAAPAPAPAAGADPFRLRRTGAAPAPATDPSADPGPAPGPQTAGTYRGLPRRIRQANLNPHLRDSPRAAARGTNDDGTPPSLTRSPEEARSLVASLQSGW